MTEQEDLKKVLKESFKETLDESQPEELPSSVAQLKEDIEKRIEAEKIGNEFLEQIMPVVNSRRELQEAEQDVARSLSVLREIITGLSSKIDALNELKQANLALERDVLNRIKIELQKK